MIVSNPIHAGPWTAAVVGGTLVACVSSAPVSLAPPQPRNSVTQAPPSGQLPPGVEPLAYELELELDPAAAGFRGKVAVTVRTAHPTTVIWLHGQGLQVDEVTFASDNQHPTRQGRWSDSDVPGVASVRFDQPLPAGEGVLRLSFRARYGSDLDGLYKIEVDGEPYLFSQLESIAARKVFPCFDEPRFKTPFSLRLRVPVGTKALTNTRVTRTRATGDQHRRITFATSPPLPTYLLAFAVGPLDIVNTPGFAPHGPRPTALPFRGVAAQGKGPALAYALRETERILQWIEAYVGRPYPYDKLDVVAVPDFAAGAMENVGLVTFREWLLLVDPNDASESQKHAFANVMAHELAHMWFGNLVTMPWWDDLWLNESFATWLASKAVAALYPDYGADLAALEGTHEAMRSDGLMSARQIREPIANNHDIQNAFDAITYEKGAAVLTMVEHWMGPEAFQGAIRRHLSEHAHGHADAEDFLASLAQGTALPVTAVMRSFLDQPGVPEIHIERACQEQPASLVLRQRHYRPLGSEPDQAVVASSDASSRAARWAVPVCTTRLDGTGATQRCHTLTEPEQHWHLDGGCPAWLLPNAGGHGYYRFVADTVDVQALQRALANRGPDELPLSPREALAWVDSVRAAFDAGTMEANTAMEALRPFANAQHAEVAAGLMSMVRVWLDDLGLHASEQAQLRQRATRWFGATLERLPHPEAAQPQSSRARSRQSRAVRFAALTLKHERTRRQLAQAASRYLGLTGQRAPVGSDKPAALAPAALPPGWVGTALRVAAEDGDANVWEALFARLGDSNDAVLRARVLTALGSINDEQVAERVRRLSLSTALRGNEKLIALRRQLGQPGQRASAWSWLENHIDTLAPQIAPSRRGQLPWLAAGGCSQAAAEQVRTLFEPRIERLAGGPRNLAGTLEAIQLCIARQSRHRAAARRYLSDPAPSP